MLDVAAALFNPEYHSRNLEYLGTNYIPTIVFNTLYESRLLVYHQIFRRSL